MQQNIIEAASYEQLSSLCAKAMLDCIVQKPDAVICLATGHSPQEAYREFVQQVNTRQIDISRVTFVKLDEWIGVRLDDPVSSEVFLQREILQPLNVKPEQYISFQSDPPNALTECSRVAAEIKKRGHIDLLILGMGQNGHIGLNEPNEELVTGIHLAELAASTRSHAMLANAVTIPLLMGISLGMEDIFAARRVVLLVTGAGKADALAAFDKGTITTRCPVTFLHLHPDLLGIFDRSSL
jgi:galactosamine-6-phosphate isomerase